MAEAAHPAAASNAKRTTNATAQPGQTNRTLRVALLGYRSNPFSGGQGVYISSIARGLALGGHQVDVISGEPYPHLPDHPNIRLIKLPGLNLFAEAAPHTLRLGELRSFTSLFEWVSMNSGGFPEPYTFGRRVYQYLRQHLHRYDIVHDNQTLSPGVLKLQQLGVPLVCTIHHPITFDRDIALANTTSFAMRLLIRRWHNFLHMQSRVAAKLPHIITVSNNSKQDISQAFNVDPARIEVVYNGINTQLFSPRPGQQRQRDLLITTASADQPLKGTQHLIPAFAAMKKVRPNLQLLFIGKPKVGGSTEALINKYALTDSIKFVHGISAAEIVYLYATASVALVPSEYEGFGLPAAEAMACGVPVVATNGGGLPEVVGDAGVMVDKADPQALCDATLALLADDEQRQTLALAGREHIKARFSDEQAAQALQRYYFRIIQEHESAGLQVVT